MMVTRIIPSPRLCNTVPSVNSSRSLRSIIGSIFTPGGRMRSLSSFTLA